jgi:hypothetical protein
MTQKHERLAWHDSDGSYFLDENGALYVNRKREAPARLEECSAYRLVVDRLRKVEAELRSERAARCDREQGSGHFE